MFEIDMNLPKEIVADVLSKHTIENVAFVGCGASMSELYPAKYFLANNTRKLNVQIFTANEFNYDTPAWVGDRTFVITCSLGGSTPETVEANKVAKSLGCPVVAITHVAGSKLTEGVDHTIVHGFEANYAAKCEKPAYAMALALEILQQTEGTDLYDDMQLGFARIFDIAEKAAQSSQKVAKQFGEDFKDDKMVYFLASGASEKVAYATAAFLFTEMQWIDAASYNTGEYFHGPFEMTDENASYVLMMADGKTREMDTRALTFLKRFNAKVAVIDAKDFGLASHIPASVVTYFNPMLHLAVMRAYAEQIAEARQHPLTKRRYMWKLSY
ncbi:MAG: SIS domain-containing protein [Collinsella sp.]|nr:SIS domain-containing protein [Collinsella sp.]